jgi:hypothetical protein
MQFVASVRKSADLQLDMNAILRAGRNCFNQDRHRGRQGMGTRNCAT